MTVRLDRVLVGRGLGSRREVDELIRRGRVCVDGVPVRDPALHVDEAAALEVEGVLCEPLPTLLAWHKPVGVLTTLRDPWGREGVDHVLPEAWQDKFHPVGRLDADTSGLLLFSRDGALTQRLLNPRHAVPRTYVATVEVDPPADLAERIAQGVQTAEGVFTGLISAIDGRRVTITVTEGKHRMVRRMLHNAGASVVELHRVSYGDVALGDLALGAWRVVQP